MAQKRPKSRMGLWPSRDSRERLPFESETPIIIDFSMASWPVREDKEMAYAVIKTGGKQFVVEKGSTIRIPSLEAEAGKSIELDAMLTSGDGENGDSPFVGAAKVLATVVDHGRGTKIVVFKKKRRKHYKRKQGHRQGYTTVKIDSIG
jgi:large subunit ribosomal protein L21